MARESGPGLSGGLDALVIPVVPVFPPAVLRGVAAQQARGLAAGCPHVVVRAATDVGLVVVSRPRADQRLFEAS
jgi:hypothetical protein